MPATSLDQIVSLCKRRGFIFPGSEIYGGLANTWDYGPLGAKLKRRVKDAWLDTFVRLRPDMVEFDSAIFMNSKVWEASGHVSSFADPLVDCKSCKERFRGDHLLEKKLGVDIAAALKLEDVQPMLADVKMACPNCGKCDWAKAKQFNLMFKTTQGVVEGEGDDIYLRPETAQGIFVNFKNIAQTARLRLPFGVAQIGKAFRNEITPGNFTFRTREFEMMEIEYFVTDAKAAKKSFDEWQKAVWEWFVSLGISEKKLRIREHGEKELSHYSSRTIDIEYEFPWGWGELFGLADRGTFDLSQHEKVSGQDLKYTDPDDPKKKFLPHVVEPSFGVDRTILTILIDAYTEDEVKSAKGTKETRTVLKLDKRLAPYDCAVLPLSKSEKLIAKAEEIYRILLDKTDKNVEFDITGSIGKRYRRQDEIGTPTCITVDFGTIGEDENQCKKDHVTVRDRDSLEQKEVAVEKLVQ